MSPTTSWSSHSSELRSVLRIVAAFMFLLAGTTKLFAFPTAMPGGGVAPLWSLMFFAGLIEFVGGILLLLGLFARPVAFIMSGEMAVAYFMVHFKQSPWPTVNGGVSAVLYCFLFLYFSAAGAGVWSLDTLRYRSAHRMHPVEA